MEPFEDLDEVVARVVALTPTRRFGDIEWQLRRCLQHHRDSPHVHLLLATVVVCSNDWDAVRPYLTRARALAPNDAYVLDGVAAFEFLLGEPWAVDRAAALLVARGAGEEKSAPPETWPGDVVRDLRRAVLSDGPARIRRREAFESTLKNASPEFDRFLRAAADLGHDWAVEAREVSRQLSAMDRLTQRADLSTKKRTA